MSLASKLFSSSTTLDANSGETGLEISKNFQGKASRRRVGRRVLRSELIDIIRRTFHNRRVEASTPRGFMMERAHYVRLRDPSLVDILVRNLAEERRRFRSKYKRQVRLEVTFGDELRLESARDTEAPSRNLAVREREAVLYDGLQRLPDHFRQVVVWHHREQQSFEEIGRRCRFSGEAARKLWTRAHGRLCKELGPAHASR
jgi:DNA-directed RNA polymerase specialized sigma24 family protein